MKSGVCMRFSDGNLQNWSAKVESSPLCINYKVFKSQIGFEHYLTALPKDLRVPFSKFRCGSHNLPISNARYLEIDERNNCNLCSEDIGDEYHYLLKCPAFSHLRSKFLTLYCMKPFPASKNSDI